MEGLLDSIGSCRICAGSLPHTPRPVLAISTESRILIIGQAPGRKVHESGIPWDDKSGERLREWLGVSSEEFYNTSLFGIMPMGFCYPGKGNSGDLPPRKECAVKWHASLVKLLQPRLTLLVGSYAQNYYLQSGETLSSNMLKFDQFLPQYFPIPHPSPLNGRWLKNNPFFFEKVVPKLRTLVGEIIR